MATYYFLGTVDSDWDTTNNWWDGPDPLSATQGFNPSSGDDTIILATLTTASVSNPITVNSITIESGGSISGLTVPVVSNVECANGATIEPIGAFTMTGNLTFSGSGSTLNSSATNYIYIVSGNLQFSGTWTGTVDYVNGSLGDTIYYYGYSGTETNISMMGNSYYANYPTLYYNNAASDGDWSNLNNWWVDSGYTQKAAELPGSSTDVEIYASVTSNGGSADTMNVNSYSPTVVTIDTAVTVSTVANFNGGYDNNDAAYLGSSGEIIGNAAFNQSSANNGTVTGNATFNNNSTNSGTVTGNADVVYPHLAPFYSTTGNTGTIGGTISYVSYPSRNLNFIGAVGGDWADIANWEEQGTPPTPVSYVALSVDNVTWKVSGNNITNSIPNFIPTVNNLTTDVLSSIYLDTPLVVLGTATIDVGDFVVINSNYISGVFDFVDALRTITFNDSSYNEGTINCVGGTPSVASTNTIIFNESSYNNGTIYAPDGFSNFDFNDTSYNSSVGTITGYPTFNNSSYNQGSITGNVEFKDSSSNSGTITGDATVYYPLNRNGAWNTGSVSGTTNFSDYPTWFYFLLGEDYDWNNTNNWFVDPPIGTTNTPSTETKAAYIPGPLDDVRIYNDVSSNSGPAADVGTLEVLYNNADISINLTVKSASFNETSSFSSGYTMDHNMSPNGPIVFNDLSSNAGTINVISPGVEFRDSSTNTGTLNINGGTSAKVYYPVVIPLGGTINGTIEYYDYPLYFTGAVNDDWNTTGNWFLDSGGTISAGSTPTETYPGTNVTLLSSVGSSSGGTPTAYNLYCANQSGCPGDNPNPGISLDITVVVNGLATFTTDTFCINSSTGGILTGTITGDALFKHFGSNQGGTISGLTTFDLTAAENMILNGYDGTYSGGIEFQYGKGVNGSNILGIV